MPPKGSAKAPPPAQFAIAQLEAGRKKWSSGTSGPLVRAQGDMLVPARDMRRHETILCGKALFGRSRLAFEVQEIDNDPEVVASRLKLRGEERERVTTFNTILARDRSPMTSIQIKFEDIVSIEETGELITLRLAAAPKCLGRLAGQPRSATLQNVADITGGAKTISFRAAAPPGTDAAHRKGQANSLVHFSDVKAKILQESPRLRALFSGQRPPETPPKAVAPRKRQSETPGGIAKRLRKEARGGSASSAAVQALVDVEDAKGKLNAYVKRLAATVDADWHDSYEETAEECNQWFEDCGERVRRVWQVGVVGGQEFGACHEILCIVADTWSNINAIPFRGDPGDDIAEGEGVDIFEAEDGVEDEGQEEDEELCDGHGRFRSPEALIAFVWPSLLARAASDPAVPDGALFRMIKDAVDNGVPQPEAPAPGEAKTKLSAALRSRVAQGRRRAAELAARRNEWQTLPSTKKTHRMRRCIDRRFDGPKYLRTRNYSDSEDEGGIGRGCSMM